MTLLQHPSSLMQVRIYISVGDGLETQDKSLALHRTFEKHLPEDSIPRKGIPGSLRVKGTCEGQDACFSRHLQLACVGHSPSGLPVRPHCVKKEGCVDIIFTSAFIFCSNLWRCGIQTQWALTAKTGTKEEAFLHNAHQRRFQVSFPYTQRSLKAHL